jgi:hypothetical protein
MADPSKMANQKQICSIPSFQIIFCICLVLPIRIVEKQDGGSKKKDPPLLGCLKKSISTRFFKKSPFWK